MNPGNDEIISYFEKLVALIYTVTVWCYNCGHSYTVSITKGTLVADTPCIRCECKTLSRVGYN